MEMFDQIDAIERHLFQYEIAKAGVLLTDTVTHLAAVASGMPLDKTKTFNAILEYLNLGMHNTLAGKCATEQVVRFHANQNFLCFRSELGNTVSNQISLIHCSPSQL